MCMIYTNVIGVYLEVERAKESLLGFFSHAYIYFYVQILRLSAIQCNCQYFTIHINEMHFNIAVV